MVLDINLMPKDNPSYISPSIPRVMKKANNGGSRSPWLVLVVVLFVGFSVFYMMNRGSDIEETEMVSKTVTGISVKVLLNEF
jgi:hypothetical protein